MKSIDEILDEQSLIKKISVIVLIVVIFAPLAIVGAIIDKVRNIIKWSFWQ